MRMGEGETTPLFLPLLRGENGLRALEPHRRVRGGARDWRANTVPGRQRSGEPGEKRFKIHRILLQGIGESQQDGKENITGRKRYSIEKNGGNVLA